MEISKLVSGRKIEEKKRVKGRKGGSREMRSLGVAGQVNQSGRGGGGWPSGEKGMWGEAFRLCLQS